jgi:hypothetical protein
MRIDHTHKPWMLVAAAGTVAGALIYIPYAIYSAAPGGGTGIGLAFGGLTLGLMVFAALLSVRKRFPIWRIGRAQKWMRAHLWLGLLALPMMLYHSAFHARGSLTAILFWLTILVVGSGLMGAWLQHTLPTRMFREVPFETIYDQIPVIRAQLAAEARDRAVDVTQSLAPALGPGATVVDTMMDQVGYEAETVAFDRFFAAELTPYLSAEGGKGSMRNRDWANEQFENFRRMFPKPAWEPISAIEEICEEKRQLDRQARLHRLLHSWLLVHLPFSAALILLGIIHAIGALRY